MKNIIDHLQKGGSGLFEANEMTEPLLLTYNILRWAVRDQADTIRFHKSFVDWYRDDMQIGKYHPTTLIPIIGFSAIIEQIIMRDQVVEKMLKVTSKEPDKITYRISY